ncbi:hypothetical protein PAPHI01_0833 [Pancytospora philotis]|nr:hypothetical protein PAPHI01_0833 [Pancytospora philotis]
MSNVRQETRAQKKHIRASKLDSRRMHSIFFLVAVCLYTVLLGVIRTTSSDVVSQKIDANLFVFLVVNRMVIYILFIKSILETNIYTYYIAILLLIEKFAIVMIYLFDDTKLVGRPQTIVLITVLTLIGVEMLYVCLNLAIRRDEIFNMLFKISGASPGINSKCKGVI